MQINSCISIDGSDFLTQEKKGTNMNWDRIEGNWKQLKGSVRQMWGQLANNQFEVIAGKRERQCGRVQESYGCFRDKTEKLLAARQVSQK
jgi:uncharacterized protein YjbJ (UPF0337 family)